MSRTDHHLETLKETTGVYGARFSGAGYRGCCIGLVDPKYKNEIQEKMDAIYLVEHSQYEDVYDVNFCKVEDGARYVTL